MARRLWNARNFQLLALSVNLGYRFYAHNLHRFYNCDWQLDPMLPAPGALFTPRARDRTIAIAAVPKNKAVCG
jgi:hypothetical protein